MEFVLNAQNGIRFNTASGMDCMQLEGAKRKERDHPSFNTASGMDCMQFAAMEAKLDKYEGFNTASGMDCMQWYRSFISASGMLFQYRKRYGLHAIAHLLY